MASNGTRSNQHGLIILGNSGVGKSFLANVLLGEEAFTHEFSARSVTHRTEFREIKFNDYRYAIFNVPGLIEADQVSLSLINSSFQLGM
jgi:putative ribosome biogenesis GTPase RsgA